MATAELKTLHDELNMLLKTVPGKAVSASKVQAVAKACFHARRIQASRLAVEQFIKKAPAHCRLAGVYAIDAVCRRSKAQLKDKDPFVARFGKEIGATLQCLDASSLEDRQRLVKVVCEWTKQKLFDVDFNNSAAIKRGRATTAGSPGARRAEGSAAAAAAARRAPAAPKSVALFLAAAATAAARSGVPTMGRARHGASRPRACRPRAFRTGRPRASLPNNSRRAACLVRASERKMCVVASMASTRVVPRRRHAAAGLPAPAVPAAAVAAGRPAADAPAHPGGAGRRLRPYSKWHAAATGARSAATSTRGARSATAATRRSPSTSSSSRPVVEKEPLVDKFEDDDEAFDAGIAV